MSHATALYRKYRPRTFAEVKNQDHIVKVLQGAIKKNKIPHALLFAGDRGTGKTTLARIFAHEIGTRDVDLYEIDAASNRGIDDIRALKEAVHTAPYESPYKVYIIDEVHMLTKEAFNALLKTLEEPPAHVVFMLATTEVDKLLDTIISRCQVFTLRSPSRAALVELVLEVSKKEGFTLSPASADLIALSANGSFRDALSIAQKILLLSDDDVGDVDEVADVIGAPRVALLTQLLSALHEKDVAAAQGVIDAAVAAHVDMKLFMRLLLERLRIIILARNIPAKREALLDSYTSEEKETLETLIDTATSLHSHTLLALLAAAERVVTASITQLPLELFCLDHCTRQ